MKKVLILTVALIFVFSGIALAGVANSKHDMVSGPSSTASHDGSINAGATSGTTDQVCVFCHHPHRTGASATDAQLLWNRNGQGVATATYNTYTSGLFTTGGIGGTLGSGTGAHHTRLCLSCHDSTFAVTVVDTTPIASSLTPGYALYTISGQANIGGDDLQNDHPVDFNYDQVQTVHTEFPASSNDTIAGTGGTYPLYGGLMECGTCHDPHNSNTSAGVQFIRNADGNGPPLAGSKLCTDCHRNH